MNLQKNIVYSILLIVYGSQLSGAKDLNTNKNEAILKRELLVKAIERRLNIQHTKPKLPQSTPVRSLVTPAATTTTTETQTPAPAPQPTSKQLAVRLVLQQESAMSSNSTQQKKIIALVAVGLTVGAIIIGSQFIRGTLEPKDLYDPRKWPATGKKVFTNLRKDIKWCIAKKKKN